MKKHLSYLLVFSLFFFSFFSTGCGRSGGGFKFLGAIVAGTIALSSGGAAAPVFAANLRGATKEAISASKVTVKVYEVDPTKDKLEGTLKNEVGATFKDGKTLSFKTDETKKLEIGEYIFVASYKVNNIDINFLRGVLTINGNTDNLKFDITPETEVKTNVYKEWIKENPEVTTFANFEGNMKKAPQATIKKIETQITQYEAKLAEWAAKDDSNKATEDVAKNIDVKDIAKEIPTETEVAPIVTNPIDTEFAKKVPTALQSYGWTPASVSKLANLDFSLTYIKNNSSWVKLNTAESIYYEGVSFSSLTDPEDLNDNHKIPTQLLEWLMGRVQNGEVTIPSDENIPTNLNLPEHSGPFMLKNVTFENDGKEMKFAVYHWPLNGDGLEFLRNEAHECAVAKNGKYTYLYLKNKDTTAAFGEIIFIHEPYE